MSQFLRPKTKDALALHKVRAVAEKEVHYIIETVFQSHLLAVLIIL